jgi:hypothetical protein
MTSLVTLFFGVGILAVAYRANQVGEIPAGAGLRPYRPTRTANPVAFHFFLTLYLCGGLALVVWAILALAGVAAPIPVD